MKIYTVNFNGHYGIGMVVVAANNPKEAADVSKIADSWFSDWSLGPEKPQIIRGATITRKKACVLDSCCYQE